MEALAGFCENCMGSNDALRMNSSHSGENSNQLEPPPILPVVFFVLAALSFVGGIILSSEFWPGNSGYGREWGPKAYILSIIWFTAGVIEAAIFAAIGKGLSYLHIIAKNTSRGNDKYEALDQTSDDKNGAAEQTEAAGVAKELFEATRAGDFGRVQALVASGVNPHMKDSSGYSAADYARGHGFSEIENFLKSA